MSVLGTGENCARTGHEHERVGHGRTGHRRTEHELDIDMGTRLDTSMSRLNTDELSTSELSTGKLGTSELGTSELGTSELCLNVTGTH